ncbi:MAG: SulP family inorganic anion transporter, partial [bacterium]|nr:SulP family inorganic anion transporter [bacterium]
MLTKILPFLAWFKDYDLSKFRIDFICGITVALVLIPQSMAYAQLAGLPPYYGLYASFLPPMIAALFGSSRQLATGPVAVVSLMTAASLEPLATAGSEAFIAYAVLLALTVGIFQFLLGVFKLGLIVNFLSHPVVNGFTNAAAIIIASSQLSKMFGVYVDKAPHHYETIIRVIKAAVAYTHGPTLLIGVLSIVIMVGLKRLNPRIPNVLVAVVITTLISWGIGFEHNYQAPISAISSPEIQEKIGKFNLAVKKTAELGDQRAELFKKTEQMKHSDPASHGPSKQMLNLEHEIALIGIEIQNEKHHAHILRKALRDSKFSAVEAPDNTLMFYNPDALPRDTKTDGRVWRLKLGNKLLDENELLMMGGGDVVGIIPKGLPTLSIPR